MDEQTPVLDGAGEGAEDLELTPKVPTEPTELGGDPLDSLQSVEEAVAEAKKFRSIARRLEKKPDVKPEVKPVVPSEFLTKQDFYKANERKAVREATADAEVKANWNEIIPFYTPRRGKETPEDIKEDIQDAITLYKARHVEVPKDDSKNQLTTTTVVKSGGGTVDKAKTSTPNPPNFKLPTQPKDWYKK